jgi:peptidoglycan/LPS O-acetylase OafA/YrhL
MARQFSRGSSGFFATYRRAVRTGVVTGVLFAALFSAWLVIANRLPFWEIYATQRNAAAALAGLVIALVPVLRFARSPRELLVSGEISWSLLSLCYFLWTFYFDELADRWSTLHILTMGAVTYALVAALSWLGRASIAAREQHHARLPHSAEHPRRHTLTHS